LARMATRVAATDCAAEVDCARDWPSRWDLIRQQLASPARDVVNASAFATLLRRRDNR
jgi:hypothetical protein